MATILSSRSNSYDVGFANNLFTVGDVTAASGNYILVIINNDEQPPATIAAPVWNGITLPQIFAPVTSFSAAASGIAGDDLFTKTSFFGGFVNSSGTEDVSASLSEYRFGHIVCLVIDGADVSTPLSSLSTQQVWTPWSDPSRTVASVASGDLVISVLAAALWDNGYSDVPATTWTPNAGQTSLINSSIAVTKVGRLILSSKSGSGSVDVGYAPSAGEPVFASFAFAIKTDALPPNPGIRLKIVDASFADSPDLTGVTAVVRAAINSTAVLYETASATIVDGYLVIDDDLVGAIDAGFYVAIKKAGATTADDKYGAGEGVVVDLSTGDES